MFQKDFTNFSKSLRHTELLPANGVDDCLLSIFEMNFFLNLEMLVFFCWFYWSEYKQSVNECDDVLYILNFMEILMEYFLIRCNLFSSSFVDIYSFNLLPLNLAYKCCLLV